MLEIQEKYDTAKVFVSDIEEKAIKQIKNMGIIMKFFKILCLFGLYALVIFGGQYMTLKMFERGNISEMFGCLFYQIDLNHETTDPNVVEVKFDENGNVIRKSFWS